MGFLDCTICKSAFNVIILCCKPERKTVYDKPDICTQAIQESQLQGKKKHSFRVVEEPENLGLGLSEYGCAALHELFNIMERLSLFLVFQRRVYLLRGNSQVQDRRHYLC